MAKVMVSIPDDLLVAIDQEARQRGSSRSALLQEAARREVGVPVRERGSILRDLDEVRQSWKGPLDAAELIRADRRRDG